MPAAAPGFARRRNLFCVLISAAVLLLADPRAANAEPGVPDPPNNLLTDRGKGEISDADEDFVVKVRLAGLWEIPAGEMAQERSDSPEVRSIGSDIAEQHRALDKLVRDAAKKLDIALPAEPNADQQGWLDEMGAAEGGEFDQIYIDRLRAAHGKIFPAIATIRTSTRNDTVRKLAQRANQFVMTHLTLLESSNLVDFAALPTAPPPNTAPTRNAASVSSVDAAGPYAVSLPTVVLLMVGGIGGALLITWRLMRDPRRRYRHYRGGY